MKPSVIRQLATGAFSAAVFVAFVSTAAAQTSRRTAPDAGRPAPKPMKADEAPMLDAAPKPPGKIGFYAAKKDNSASHNGEFERWHFTEVNLPNGGIEGGKVTLEVDLSSVKTNAGKLDGHLQTPDFFNVAEFPKATISFMNPKPVEGKENTYTAEGEADIHGVKAPITTEFMVESKEPLKVKGTATIDRTKFGVGKPFNAEDGKSILPEVKVTYETEVVNAPRVKVQRVPPAPPVMPNEKAPEAPKPMTPAP